MDEVRASVARALGQPGCRARVLVCTSGEISGPAPFRDAPEVRAAAADAALTVVGYARVKKKDKKPEPGSAPSHARVTNAKAATNANCAATTRTAKTPPASPGLRAPRNYIRESFPDEESARGADALADPLAAPVGGHARPESRARASTPARTERTASVARALKELEKELEEKTARDGTNRPAGRDDTLPAPSAGDAMWAVLREEVATVAVDDAAERLGENVEAVEADLGDVPGKNPEPEPKPERASKRARREPKENRKKTERKRKEPKEPKDASLKKACRGRETAPEPIAESVAGLPPCLERLAKAYDATTAIVAFLRAQRVRSTWGQIEPAVRGAATLEDLGAAARLCPRALRLARRVVVPSAEAEETRALEGDRPGGRPGGWESADQKKDTLVEVFDAGARARGDAEDEPFGGALESLESLESLTPRDSVGPRSPARRVVVHGSRTSRATYAVGDETPAEPRIAKNADALFQKRSFSNARGVSGEAFAKRASAAFRAALGRLVIAEVDASMDREGMASVDAWARAERASLATFAARAATLAAEDAAADAARTAAAPSVFSYDDARSDTRKRRRAPGGGRRVCERCDALDVEAFIEHLTSGPDALGARGAPPPEFPKPGVLGPRTSDRTREPPCVGGCVEHRRDEPARAARFGASLADVLSPATVAALAATGVRADALFSHQSSAVAAALRGENVVVATGTASGKSACYNAPAFEALFRDPNATALYLFPTKALARDQLGKIRTMLAGARAASSSSSYAYHPFDAGAYDGDTPEDERTRIHASCRLVVTNPDTLHVSLLPNHRVIWRAFFAGLKMVVLDEAHVYRGVFGSHVALVLRRLRRLCREVHGVDPAFAVSSATIGEPLRHAVDLVGAFPRLHLEDVDRREAPSDETDAAAASRRRAPSDVTEEPPRDEREEAPIFAPRGWTAITTDGSPRGAKTFLMWNPPRKDALDPIARASSSRRRRREPSETPARGKRAVAEKLRGVSETSDATPTATANANEAPRFGEETRRVSPIVEMAHLLVECARHDLRVIAFCKTKKLCELVLRYARELLANSNGTRFLETLRAYRGGYTAGDRRATESALFDGSLRAVAATNALELGVDVGVLDATLHLGFPGSTSSLTQQAGRAGRRGKRALGIYVAFDGPLDQYFMRRPEKLFEAAEKERAAIDCANPAILAAHVACAAYELPLDPRPEGVDARTYFFTGAETRDAPLEKKSGERFCKKNENEPSDFRVAAEALVRDAKLARDPSVAASRAGDLRLRWVGDSASGPARGVSVRTIESERYAVVDMDTGKTVEEIEASKAFWSVHPGAVYLNQARTFLVKALDVEARVARVRRADVKYFTRSVDTTRLTLVDNSGSKAAYPDRPAYPAAGPVRGEKRRASSAQTAACEVVIQFTGFKKVHQGTGAFFDEVSFARDLRVELPPVTFRTVASWVRVPESARKLARDAGVDFNEAAHAASHALANALPLLLLASHADVAAECFAAAPGVYAPRRLLLYDKHPGGVGIARRAAPVFLELMRLALERVEACDCGAECEAAPREELGVADAETADLCLPVPAPSGCPGCTHYASCDHYNDGLDKRGAVVVLRETIRVEEMRLRELAAGEDPSRGEGFVNVSS